MDEVTCTRCGNGLRWRKGLWCAGCIRSVCCEFNRRRRRHCVHGRTLLP